jgi:predicted nuclease of restriction endonuclease-like RecB superfamily
MLTSRLVRVRYARNRIVPCYLDVDDAGWRETSERLLDLYRSHEGHTRGELEEELREVMGNDPAQLVHQGLAKLLEDRCEFEVVSAHPPEQLRESVFTAAAAQRLRARPVGLEDSAHPTMPSLARAGFDRDGVLQKVAQALKMKPEAVEQGLFADLKSEQRLIRFKDITVERLLQRYNVGLAQAVLLRSTRVHVAIVGESSQRYRQLFRLAKFHRLVCESERNGPDGYLLHLDGPLSLFTATQKYGLQLALFLPAVLRCREFELRAELSWGPERKPKVFTLSPADGLVSHYADSGMYVPPELAMFVDLFRKKITGLEISEETDIQPLGDSFWVPDFRITEQATGRSLYLEVLGFWRRASAERHLARLRQHARQPFLLAVSDQLRVDDADLEGLPAGIHRFRQMPLPDEVARLAREVLEQAGEVKARSVALPDSAVVEKCSQPASDRKPVV